MLVGRLRTLSPTSSPRPHRVVFGPGQWQRTKPQAGLNVCVCALLLLVVAVVGREGGPGEPYTQRIHCHSHKDSRALWASCKGFASLGTERSRRLDQSHHHHTQHTHTVSLTTQRLEIMSPYPLAVQDAGVWLAMWTDVHLCAIKWNEAEKLSHHAV